MRRARHPFCRSQRVQNAKGLPLGTFVLGFPEPRSLDAFDEQLIVACANLVALALERRRTARQQDLIVGELQHRVRNLFASIGALANVSAGDDVAAFRATFEGGSMQWPPLIR